VQSEHGMWLLVEAHNSKDCSTKFDKSAVRKYAVWKGAHEAWNNRWFRPSNKSKQQIDTFAFTAAPV
jgi:hypothetical protein